MRNWTLFVEGAAPMPHRQVHEITASDLRTLPHDELLRKVAAAAAAIDCYFGARRKSQIYYHMRAIKDNFGVLAREGLRRLGRRFPIPAADGHRMTQRDLLVAAQKAENLPSRVLLQKFMSGAAVIGASFGKSDMEIPSLWGALDKLGHELLRRFEQGRDAAPA